MSAPIATLLDLDRYPLDRPGCDAHGALVARCVADLARDGMFSLAELLRPEIAASTARTLTPLIETEAFEHARSHNIYFQDQVPGLGPDHPALRKVQTRNRTLCADQLEGSPLPQVYGWPPLRAFLAQVMGMAALYPMEDPLARVNVMSYGAGDALNWHFDRSEFTTTLLLQAPLVGGAFEYRTNLRSARDPNHVGVARLLEGADPQVRQVTLSAGTLNVFRGINTPHRVTPVEGDVARMIAVFSYFQEPGVRFSPAEQIGFYGRAL